MKQTKYYIGLDIGTNSIGWAVTDDQYNLCRFNGKSMWGIHLFDSAKTAEERRLNRANRRRMSRKKDRIQNLQELLKEEIEKIDPTFLVRVKESRLYLEDKSTKKKNVLFVDDNYTDIEFHKDFPTLYHLRYALITDTAPHDIRLLYIALQHIMKSRGHFLAENIDAKDYSMGSNFSDIIDEFKSEYQKLFESQINVEEELENVLKNRKITAKEKANQCKTLITEKNQPSDKNEKKISKKRIDALCKLLIGQKAGLKAIFPNCENSYDINFSNSEFEEKTMLQLEKDIPNSITLINSVRKIYNWQVFEEIMHGEEYFSCAQIKKYNKHNEDLNTLRKLFKKYLTHKEYRNFFYGESKGSYSAYVGSLKKNGKKKYIVTSSKTAFFDNVKKILEKIKNDNKKMPAKTANLIEDLLVQAENHDLCPLQRTKDNSVVPKQLHELEMNKILENAEKHFPFLNEKDELGLSVSDKIKSVFNFKIPYFVGPLGENNHNDNDNHWMVRKEGKESKKIMPWNMEDIIDYEKSNERFIRRMTNKCTALNNEDVLPKNSLLYSYFMVLNELNNLKINGVAITVEQKQDIFQNLFCQYKKVTSKKIEKYLQTKNETTEDILLSGIDENPKTSLASLYEMHKIFGSPLTDEQKQMAEDIILWATIYGNDTMMLEKIIKKHYGDIISKDQLDLIKKLRLSGWGNFSEKFLTGISGKNLETGECYDSIIDCMWETNNNVQQVLSKKFDFNDTIKAINNKVELEKGEVKFDYSLVEKLSTSPANKRGIWHALRIVKEISDIMKCPPDKIFIEMARGGNDKKERTVSRKEKLIKIYENKNFPYGEEERKRLLKEIEIKEEKDFRNDKVYLYYCQAGRCAYSGEIINPFDLMNPKKWDSEHLFPQSKIKDDSITNNIVLVKRTLNAEKAASIINPKIQKNMVDIWKKWLNCGMISKKKFDRLIYKGKNGTFADEDLAGYLEKQLVETRQITKNVANLLELLYPKTSVLNCKAKWVSEFRRFPLKMFKSRRANDYHHAKDAYLVIVVGNVYNAKFTSNPLKWIKENKGKKWSVNKVFHYDVKGAWKAPVKDDAKKGELKTNKSGNPYGGTLDTVKATMLQNNILYTEYTYCDFSGKLFNENPSSKLDVRKNEEKPKNKKTVYVPIKKELNVQKYGGYGSPKCAYFSVVEFTNEKGSRVKHIMGVPKYVANLLKNNPNAFIEYCTNDKKLKDAVVIIPKIKKNTLLEIDGFEMRIRSESSDSLSFKNSIQLNCPPKIEEGIRLIEKWKEKNRKTIDVKYDKINNSLLNKIFNYLVQVLDSNAYLNRPSNQNKKLIEKSEMFYQLPLEDKAIIIDEMMNLFNSSDKTANLTKIKLSNLAGKLTKSKNSIKSIKIIHQSITGLYNVCLSV